jgi:hypothetical protein
MDALIAAVRNKVLFTAAIEMRKTLNKKPS